MIRRSVRLLWEINLYYVKTASIGTASVALGAMSQAAGDASMAMGLNALAEGDASTAIGLWHGAKERILLPWV